MAKPAPPHVIVFSDVDGVLLHPSSQSMARAAAAFARLTDEPVSLVLCSLKTRAELEVLLQQLGLRQPFIAEAGAAVFVPRWYFPPPPHAVRTVAGYDVIEFGRPYDEVVRKLTQAAVRDAQHGREPLARVLESMRLDCTCRGSFDAVGGVIHPGAAVAALKALYARHHERPGVSDAIDAGDWAEAIVGGKILGGLRAEG